MGNRIMSWIRRIFGGAASNGQTADGEQVTGPVEIRKPVARLPLASMRNDLQHIRGSETFRDLIGAFNQDTFRLAEDLAKLFGRIWHTFEDKCGPFLAAKDKVRSVLAHFKADEVISTLTAKLSEAERLLAKNAENVIRNTKNKMEEYRNSYAEFNKDEAEARAERNALAFRMTGDNNAIIEITARPKRLAAILLTAVSIFVVEMWIGIPQINDFFNYTVAMIFAAVGGISLLVFGHTWGVTDRVIEHHAKLFSDFCKRYRPASNSDPYTRINDEGEKVSMDPLSQATYSENKTGKFWFWTICGAILVVRFGIMIYQVVNGSEVDWMGGMAAILLVLAARVGSFLVYLLAPRFEEIKLKRYAELDQMIMIIQMHRSALERKERAEDLDGTLRQDLTKIEAGYDEQVKAVVESAKAAFAQARDAIADFKRLASEYDKGWAEFSGNFSPTYNHLVIKAGERLGDAITDDNVPSNEESTAIFNEHVIQDGEFVDETFAKNVNEFNVPVFEPPKPKNAEDIVKNVRKELGMEAREAAEIIPMAPLSAEIHRKIRAAASGR